MITKVARVQTQTTFSNGVINCNKSTALFPDEGFFMIKSSVLYMKGTLKSNAFSRSSVIVTGAPAMSAFYR